MDATQPASPSTTRPGTGRLVFTRSGPNTVLHTAYAESPLRFLTPKNHGRAAWVYTSSFGGGFVDGDEVALNVELQEGTSAFLSTQGATRVYRSPKGCTNSLQARLANDSLLIVAPDPLALFSGARLTQRFDFELGETASLVFVDLLSAGRVAYGERWAFGALSSRLSLRRGGAQWIDEELRLDPEQGPMAARFGRFEAIATVVLAGPRARRAELPEPPQEKRSPVVVSVSRLSEDLTVLRFAGESVERVSGAVREHLDFLPELLGDDPFTRRP